MPPPVTQIDFGNFHEHANSPKRRLPFGGDKFNTSPYYEVSQAAKTVNVLNNVETLSVALVNIGANDLDQIN